jgi:hypothetical protein
MVWLLHSEKRAPHCSLDGGRLGDPWSWSARGEELLLCQEPNSDHSAQIQSWCCGWRQQGPLKHLYATRHYVASQSRRPGLESYPFTTLIIFQIRISWCGVIKQPVTADMFEMKCSDCRDVRMWVSYLANVTWHSTSFWQERDGLLIEMHLMVHCI